MGFPMKRPLILVAALLALAALPTNPALASYASTSDEPPVLPLYEPGSGPDDPPPPTGNVGREPAPGSPPVQNGPDGSQEGSEVSASAEESVAADDTEADTESGSFEEEADDTAEVDEESE